MTDTEFALIEYICTELLEDPDRELSTRDQLLLDDIVDSLGVMRLVHFIEQRGGKSIPAEDITIENFASVEAIAAYLNRRGISLGQGP